MEHPVVEGEALQEASHLDGVAMDLLQADDGALGEEPLEDPDLLPPPGLVLQEEGSGIPGDD